MKNNPAKTKTAVQLTRNEDFAAWYQEVLHLADFAEHAPVRGCMIIKPNGYALWENMQAILDRKFKERGVRNAYFPLFIPLSFLEKEAEHVEGFATETAIVTHTRLEKGPDGKLIPASKLEEPLIVRPTSEMIIGASFAKWIQSYRDLPMQINQWCNVVRWEMRPRLFLRTAEFLWQEGHTAHATEEEARAKVLEILEVYADFAETYLAIPVIRGEKSEGERFPGAQNTYTFEAMMQDGKALQMGTSHYMGTNFAKACGIRFLNEKGELAYAHTTSWGSTTRMIGAMVMAHGDDNGVILPPRLAPIQVMIIPFLMNEESKKVVLPFCQELKERLSKIEYFGRKVGVSIDDRDLKGSEKSWDAIKKGIPIRLEIGPRDIENGKVPLYLRTKEKNASLPQDSGNIEEAVLQYLEELHHEIYQRALAYREANLVRVDSLADFKDLFLEDRLPHRFALAPCHGGKALEAQIKNDYGVTIRCIPIKQTAPPASCLFTQKENAPQAVFARSY